MKYYLMCTLHIRVHIEKELIAEKDWRQEEKGTTEDEMVRWHHRLDGHKFEQALEFGNGQGILACCSPWGRKESDMTEWLNRTLHPKNSYAEETTLIFTSEYDCFGRLSC